jgi:hypothetical protein
MPDVRTPFSRLLDSDGLKDTIARGVENGMLAYPAESPIPLDI